MSPSPSRWTRWPFRNITLQLGAEMSSYSILVDGTRMLEMKFGVQTEIPAISFVTTWIQVGNSVRANASLLASDVVEAVIR